MKQYTFSADDKKLIFTIKFQSGSHCFGFLAVDANRNTDIYALGRISGVIAISKKSGYPVPTMNTSNDQTELKIEMGIWSKAFLITVDSVNIITSKG